MALVRPFLRSTGLPELIESSGTARLACLSCQFRALHQSTTRRNPLAASANSIFRTGGNPGNAAPPVYFQRSSLPANTIVKFVPQQTAYVVERMGRFDRVLSPGLALLVPILDRIAYVKSLKETAIEIPSQSAITADNVTLELDGVLYTRIFDPYKAR